MEKVLRDRVTMAADECEVTIAEWVRQALEAVLKVHESGANRPDSYEDEPEPEMSAANDPGYAERVETAARAERDRLAQDRPPAQQKKSGYRYNTRECPHVPRARVGAKCSDCGGTLPGGRQVQLTRPR
jgi:hypothetical protein